MNTRELLTMTARLALAASMTAGAYAKPMTNFSQSADLTLHTTPSLSMLIAREKEPGDDKGKDGKGHRINVAREKEPGDDKGKDGKGHRINIAREKEPGDDKGKHDKGKDGKGHRLA